MPKFDVALIGTGFASCVLAIVLQRMGFRCVLFEAHQHPRFAIGESSTPIADQILLDLGHDFDLPELVRLGRWSTARHLPEVTVGCKRGFSYFFHSPDSETVGSAFVPQLLVPASPDWQTADSHWHRASVDHYLVRCARARGAVVLENTTIRKLERKAESWALESVQHNHPISDLPCEYGTAPECFESWHADFIVDGSGLARVVPRLAEPRLFGSWFPTDRMALASDSGSLFGHFRVNPNWSEIWREWQCPTESFSFPPQFAALHHVTADGWMWHLAFDNSIVSLGWVLPSAIWNSLRNDSTPTDRWTTWQNLLARYPRLQRLYADAPLVAPPGGLGFVPQHQRFETPVAGPGWLALPHTVGFIDPLHSSGIAHGLCNVQKLVRTIQLGGKWDDDFLRLYADRLRMEFWLIDQLVALAYTSRGDAEKWEAATMMYFAAAIAFEEWRVRWRSSLPAFKSSVAIDPNYNDTPWKSPDFLFASDSAWLERVVRARGLLQRSKRPPRGWLWETADILGPMNTAGLCDPACQGIYHYTVAEK